MTIKQRQHLLAFLRLYDGQIDGIWGPKSTAAMDIVLTKYPDLDAEAALLKAVTEWENVTDNNVGNTGGDFWDEIEYFTREEFRCKCGGRYCNGFPAEPNEKMVRIANQLRKNIGVPIDVISGLRCETWNRLQGGVVNSQHMFGEAMDIRALGKSQAVVEAELDKIGGVRYHYAIAGSSNVHFDVPKGNR